MDPALIVKEGVLVKSRNHGVRLAFLKSQWVPRYFVLRRKDGTSGQFLLDQYWKQSKRKIKRSLEMDRCCKVESYLKLSETAANQQNYEWIFAIHYTKRDSEGRSKLFLAANNKEEMDAWVYELCKCCKFLADETDSYAESSLSNGVTPLFQRPRMPVDRLPLFAPDLRSEDSFLVDTPMSECGPGSFGFSRTFDETSLQLSARPKVNPSPNYIHLKGCGGSLAGSLPRRTPLPNRVSEEDDNQGKRPKENTNPYMHLNKCGTNPKPRERFVRPGPIVPHHSSGASQHSQKPSISSLEGTSPTSSQRSIVHTDPDDSSSGFDSFGSVPPPLPPKISARSSIDSSTYSGMSRDSPPLPLAPPIPAVINLDMAVPTTFPDDVYEVDTSGETIIRQRTPSPSFEEPVETPKTPFTAPPIDRSTKPRMVSLSRSDSSQSNPASPFAAHTPTRTNIFNFRDTERIIPIIPKTNPQNRQLNKQLTANDLFPHRPQKVSQGCFVTSLCSRLSQSENPCHNARLRWPLVLSPSGFCGRLPQWDIPLTFWTTSTLSRLWILRRFPR
ncbi:hypothetical protein L596_027587 [Steinernema carpocapsae]|uniref:PH domain-containing protein n=1 Tax=Steinernema carpocapsae TaxID=34508 RepID=A0A4V5ZXM0_STECR|nr:hypothetical protein L596_027587 [Steinernema carpocapsae]